LKKWHTVETSTVNDLSESNSHPLNRQHRFFDSTGPGGAPTPPRFLHPGGSPSLSHEGDVLSFKRNHFKPFAHSGYVSCLLLVRGLVENSPEVETLVSGGGDGTVKLWILDTPGGSINELAELDNGDGASLLSLATEDGFLYCGLRGGNINIWGLESRQLVRTVKSHCVDVLTIDVLGGSIFSGGSDGVIVVRNLLLEALLYPHANLILELEYSI
jgi:di- and tripeptidase